MRDCEKLGIHRLYTWQVMLAIGHANRTDSQVEQHQEPEHFAAFAGSQPFYYRCGILSRAGEKRPRHMAMDMCMESSELNWTDTHNR